MIDWNVVTTYDAGFDRASCVQDLLDALPVRLLPAHLALRTREELEESPFLEVR